MRHHERAWNGRRRHDEDVGVLALGRQRQSLLHAEAVLLVHDGQAKLAELDAGLEQSVCADENVDVAAPQVLVGLRAHDTLLAAGQDLDAHAGGPRQRLHRREVLPGQHLSRRHDAGLRAVLHHGACGEQRHDRLAGADIALKQAQHTVGGGEVGLDLAYGLSLPVGQREGQGVEDGL